MPVTLTSLADLDALEFDEVIDVRSPSEFAEDHVPGAMNLPVLDDAERARVGTIYVQESRFLARRVGAALVARNAARHLEGYLADKGAQYRPLVYCWRGGQRSGSFATILGQIGWQVETLASGYRSYRHLVQKALYQAPWPMPLLVLDGNTGTAKTALLGHLAVLGVQVIDLEGLANHRGSLFGARPGGQPSQKAFESALAGVMGRLDAGRVAVVEAESSKVGDRVIPPGLWAAMGAAPRIEIVAPLAVRAAYLARAYADMIADEAGFSAGLQALGPYHSREVISDWQTLRRDGAYEALAADLMARHYDARYAKSRARHTGAVAARVQAGDLSEAALPALARRLADEIGRVERARGLSAPACGARKPPEDI